VKRRILVSAAGLAGRASLSGEGRDSRGSGRQEKTMTAQPHHRGTDPLTTARNNGARVGRLAAVLAAITGSLLASIAVVPAASARPIPPPGGSYGPAGPVPATTIHVITAGGMAGWQITVIAVAAALVSATVAVLADRARAARRAATTV
jgi:hypothetical protein